MTGQETFFPADLICARMELILSQKDDLSLDALSSLLHQETEKRGVLTVKTALGEKIFYLNEIQSVALDDGGGNAVDITEWIKNFKHSKA